MANSGIITKRTILVYTIDTFSRAHLHFNNIKDSFSYLNTKYRYDVNDHAKLLKHIWLFGNRDKAFM